MWENNGSRHVMVDGPGRHRGRAIDSTGLKRKHPEHLRRVYLRHTSGPSETHTPPLDPPQVYHYNFLLR